MRKLTIVFHDAGGGHRSAATALQEVLSTQSVDPWQVTLLNLQQILDSLDVLHSLTGLRIQDAYNLILRKGWTRFTPQLLVVLQTTIRLYHSRIVQALCAYWRENPAGLVLSVIPHFNRELVESLRAVSADTPFVTLLTDLADYPPRFWMEKESQFIIAGTERARQQAITMGHTPERIFEASGMILKPKFYREMKMDRVAERRRLGLDPDCPTGIVLFGGYGSRVMLDIAKKLDAGKAQVQLILICGHNRKLAARLKHLKTRNPMFVEGFTSNVEFYMALSDFFIGKPGPGSISEALQFHLPVIVECNSRTLPQERYNAEWVTENGYGIVVRSFKQIAPTVDRLLENVTFTEHRCNVSAYSNRALFEVPEILDRIQRQTANLAALEPCRA